MRLQERSQWSTVRSRSTWTMTQSADIQPEFKRIHTNTLFSVSSKNLVPELWEALLDAYRQHVIWPSCFWVSQVVCTLLDLYWHSQRRLMIVDLYFLQSVFEVFWCWWQLKSSSFQLHWFLLRLHLNTQVKQLPKANSTPEVRSRHLLNLSRGNRRHLEMNLLVSQPSKYMNMEGLWIKWL